MAEDHLLEPLKGYNSYYKEKHKENTIQYFDELTKKGQVDIEANHQTVKEYNEKLKLLEEVKEDLSQNKFLKTFLIILSVVAVIAAAILAYSSFSSGGSPIPIWGGVIAIVAAVGIVVLSVCLIKLKINKTIAKKAKEKEELEKKIAELLKIAWSQMAGLNALYDWGMAAKLFTKTIPLIEMDEHFDEKKFTYLHEKYGLSENDNDQISTYFCQSGSILGNPFLLCKDYHQNWINKAYTGSLTITWTERVRTNNGTRTVTRSQVLHATIYKPAPSYGYNTYLVYGNEAAPNLNFSRKPSGASGLSEREIEKKVKSGAKKLDKKAREAVSKQSSYTRFGNDEFEVLFGGTNRDNEVEYRLLFTPLAQKNLLDLIETPEPFGDDFWIQKNCELNFLKSNHSQTADYYGSPTKFIDFDYERAKQKFIDYNTTYFENFYFELAPILSIPLYQQHKSREFIYDKEYKSNISSYEHEALANSFDINLLKPSSAATPSILKTNLIRKEGVADEVEITAHAFEAHRRVTYVPKLGGDGRTHSVPVFWLEYIPVEKKSGMAVESKNSSRFEFNTKCGDNAFKDVLGRVSKDNAYIYERGLFAFLLAGHLTATDVSGVNQVYVGNTVTPTVQKPTLEELVASIQSEMDKYDQLNAANEVDEQATEAMLKDDNMETEEVEVNDDDLQEPVTNSSNEDEDDDEDDED